MPDFFSMFIDYYLEYKYPVLAIVMLIAFNGIPIGANVYVAIAGALASTEGNSFSMLFAFVWIMAITGDLICYSIWNRFGCAIMEKRKKYMRIRRGIRKARVLLNKYGKITVLLAKFPLSGLGPYMAMTAGMTSWDKRLFIILIIIGDFIWSFVYLGIGYFFADSWEDLMSVITSFGQAGLLLALIILAFFYLKRKKDHLPIQ